MERYAVRMIWPSGEIWWIRSGNVQPQVVAPFYDGDVQEFVARCEANPDNSHLRFEILPYPYETVRA